MRKRAGNAPDVFVSIDEDAINRLAAEILLENPSLFNYGTQRVANDPSLLCNPVPAPPEGGPILTVVNPIPVPGTTVNLDFCFQIANVQVDFYPSGLFILPASVGALQPNQIAIHAQVFAGFSLDPSPPFRCFSLDLYLTIAPVFASGSAGQVLTATLVNLDFVNIQPTNLDRVLDGVLTIVVNDALLPKMEFALSALAFNIGTLARVVLVPAPITPNPAVNNDELQISFNAQVS